MSDRLTNVFAALVVAFAIQGCESTSSGGQAIVRGADRADEMRALLADPGRPAADRDRDAGRRPADVIAFAGIEPGMTVLDLIAAGGYYTEVVSHAVGPGGKVYCHNNPGFLERRGGANKRALEDRLAGGRLTNVERLDVGVRELPIEAGSLDAITLVLNFHDIYNNDPQLGVGVLRQLSTFLKPGGFIVLIDHIGDEGADNARLHRIDVASVRQAIADAGLRVIAESDLLSNPDDDHAQGVFTPGLRGNTDRFLFKVGV